MQKLRNTKFKQGFLTFLVLAVTALSLFLVWQHRGNVVKFDDPQLEMAVREHLAVPEGTLYREDVAGITELNAYGMEIRRLEGIETLIALRVLNLHDNFVEDLSPLRELEHLTSLNLRNNEIYDLELVNFDQIIHLPITELSLRHNVYDLEDGSRIRIVDITLLSALTKLEILELRDNHISDIRPLRSLKHLHTLDIRENRIVDIYPLNELDNLVYLNLRDNEISDLTPIYALKNLRYLNIHSNAIREGLAGLANFDQLETLIMRNVRIGSDDEFLYALRKLQRLNIQNTAITSLEPLGNLMESGALQDDDLAGIISEVNILENQLSPNGTDPYAAIRPFWENITYRKPLSLPLLVE